MESYILRFRGAVLLSFLLAFALTLLPLSDVMCPVIVSLYPSATVSRKSEVSSNPLNKSAFRSDYSASRKLCITPDTTRKEPKATTLSL